MDRIVVGRFTTFEEAERSARRLYERAFGRDDVSIFFLNPTGQHARYPAGTGDGGGRADTAAKRGGWGAVAGVIRGAVIGLVIGMIVYAALWRYWYVPVAGLLAGAYVGALGGALARMRGRQDEGRGTLEKTDSGVMLATHVTDKTADTAEVVLRESGAASIERVEGDWRDGEWKDFDPLRRPDQKTGGTT